MSTATINIVLATTRKDDSPLTPDQIAGTDVYDSASTTPTVPIGTVAGAGTSFTTGVLSVGAHGFTAITRDTTGHSSVMSNVASVDVPATLADPNPPTITAVLNP